MSMKKTSKTDVLNTLFFVSASEMTKSEEKIDADLILSYAEEAARLDPRYKSNEAERAAFAASVIGRAESAPAPRKRFTKKAIVILVAAAILVMTALAATAVATDMFGLFVKEPKELLEWEDGESRRVDDYEMTVSAGGKMYAATDDLIRDFGDRFIFPATPPEGYETSGIFYIPLENRREIVIVYEKAEKQIRYSVLIDRATPTDDELKNSDHEKTATQNGNTFYIMENVGGYQGIARIDGSVYIIDAAEKDELIGFIRTVKEL